MNETELKLSKSFFVTAKRDLNWNVKNPIPGKPSVTIPSGTKIEAHFSEAVPGRLFIKHEGNLLRLRLADAHDSVTGINKRPGFKTLEKYSYDSVAKTVTGHRTEPDGYGPDGSPSWLLALGMI